MLSVRLDDKTKLALFRMAFEKKISVATLVRRELKKEMNRKK